jgi:peptide/nickel transport system permease protein
MPTRLVLSRAALLCAILGSIALGALSAVKRYSLADHLITVVSSFGLSVPVFWYGLMLIMPLSVRLQLLPAGGMFTIDSAFSLAERLRYLSCRRLCWGPSTWRRSCATRVPAC